MNHSQLFTYTSTFSQNDWRQVSIQFDSSKNPKYIPVIESIKTLYSNYDKTEAAHLVRNNMIDAPKCVCGATIKFRKDPQPYYPVFCTLKCKSKFSNTQAEPIIASGKKFINFEQAIDELGIARDAIRQRIFDPTYPDYKWDVVDHDAKCIEKLKAHSEVLLNVDALNDWKLSGDSQQVFCEAHSIEPYQLRYALLYFGISSKFEQTNQIAREFLSDKERFIKEFNECSMERLALIYQVSTGTIKNYGRRYGLDTSLWARKVSKAENELYNFVLTICPDAIQSYRNFFGKNGKELDIYIPSKNLGIEFNGIFTHSDKNKAKEYHRNKHLQFREIGVRYIQIWEDDWTYRNDKVKRFITNALGANLSVRVGARKTKVCEITQNQFDEFLEENHMQGNTKAKYRLALMSDGKVMAVMGFREIASNVNVSYANGKGIDLVRFANTNVSGAFSKLLSYFEKTYTYDYVLSYADLEIVSPFDNVYTKHGFSFVKEIKEDYRYFNGRTKEREHKFNWRKEKFKKIGIDITDKTEFQLADELGLLRCYDSGKILYVKNLDTSNQPKRVDVSPITLDFG